MIISKQKSQATASVAYAYACALLIVLRKFQLLVNGEISSFFVVSANKIDDDVDDIVDDDEKEKEDVYLILTCMMRV